MLTCFLVVFLPIYFLNRKAIDSFDDFTSKALEDEMTSHGFMIGEQYKAMVLNSHTKDGSTRDKEFETLLKIYGPKVQSRFRIVSPKGIILFDSGKKSMNGVNIANRKEIAMAMTGKYGARWALSEDRSHVFYYTASPIDHDGRLACISYVSRHTGPITKAIIKMALDQRIALICSLAFAVILSAIVAQTLTRRLRRLTRSAMLYAQGKAILDLQVGGNDEIAQLGHAVNHMASEIEKRNDYNRDFISAVMHELKTPITAIRGAAEVLQQGAAEKKEVRDKFLSNIRYESDRLTRMVGELNELTKLDADTLRGHREAVDYCQCIEDTLERLVPTFDEKHASFSISIPGEPIAALIMPGRIEQVISNLLENAFRYTPPSGHVELVVEQDGDSIVRTIVRDNGPGIAPGNMDKVFDKFFTTEPKDVPREYGSGLGLAIARNIVENHQGRIWVESEPGKGTCFYFTLPTA